MTEQRIKLQTINQVWGFFNKKLILIPERILNQEGGIENSNIISNRIAIH